jgi:hypothetical protein
VTTVKIALLVGVLGSAIAVGLAYVVAGIQDMSPTVSIARVTVTRRAPHAAEEPL